MDGPSRLDGLDGLDGVDGRMNGAHVGAGWEIDRLGGLGWPRHSGPRRSDMGVAELGRSAVNSGAWSENPF